NVVGGVVMMLSFLSSSMSSATQRFFSYDLGRGDLKGVQRTFSSSFFVYIIISLIIVLFAETLGIWFVKKVLIIPKERMDAALWSFQFSIFTFVVSILTIPYN